MSSESRPSEIAMRSRVGRTSSDLERRKDQNSYKDTVIIERKIKAGDTLNKIAIQYSVNVSLFIVCDYNTFPFLMNLHWSAINDLQVSDIKRVNNLVTDQDFVALTVVKIPVSRMRHALGIGSSSSEDDEHIIGRCSSGFSRFIPLGFLIIFKSTTQSKSRF